MVFRVLGFQGVGPMNLQVGFMAQFRVQGLAGL